MADLLPDIDTIKAAGQNLAGGFSQAFNNISTPDGIIYGAPELNGDGIAWEIDGSDWYKVFAYQFAVQVTPDGPNLAGPPTPQGVSANGTPPNNEYLYTLPIPPQSLVTRMVPASQATPTVGGVVEETSANVFWLINMSGTTGIAVSRSNSDPNRRDSVAKQFRDKITTTGLLSGPLAGLNSAIGKIGGVADTLIGAVSNIDSAQGALNTIGAVGSGVVGAINASLLPSLPYSGSAVKQDTNGYTEMQELHRFLYTYSRLKAAKPNKYSLVFRNFKTGQEWNCIVQDFQIQQSAQNPMLYKYSISLKCWSVADVSGSNFGTDFDRFGPNGDLAAVSTIDPTQMGILYDALAHHHTGRTLLSMAGNGF